MMQEKDRATLTNLRANAKNKDLSRNRLSPISSSI